MSVPEVAVVDQPDLSMVFAIHQSLTQDAAALAAAVADLAPEDRAERIGTIRRFFSAYARQLEQHHHHEDELFFPALAAKVGAEAMALDRLEAQHIGLDDAVATVHTALETVDDERTEFASAKARTVRAVDTLVTRLGQHLALEEGEALPLYARFVSAEEHAVIVQWVQAVDPFESLFFMVPWLFDRIPAEVRTGVLQGAPEVFRTVYAEHVDGYRQLVRALQVRRREV